VAVQVEVKVRCFLEVLVNQSFTTVLVVVEREVIEKVFQTLQQVVYLSAHKHTLLL
jgi:hypothetical protein